MADKKDKLRSKRSGSSDKSDIPEALSTSSLLTSMLEGGAVPPPQSELLQEHEKLQEEAQALQKQNEALQETVENSLVSDGGVFYYKRFAITKTGLAFPEDGEVSREEWVDVGWRLKQLDEAIQWNIGDLCVYAAERWGATYEEMAQWLDYEKQTLRTYAYVSQSVHPLIRINTLSHAHHRLVASIRLPNGDPDTERQGEWLQQAAEHNWTLADFRRALKSRQLEEPASPLADPSNRRAFNRLWRSLEHGTPVQREDVERIERWLEAVKRSL